MCRAAGDALINVAGYVAVTREDAKSKTPSLGRSTVPAGAGAAMLADQPLQDILCV
jgi:hypothetical protein